MKRYFSNILLFVFFITGCSSNQSLQSRRLEEYYTSTGVEKYFLSDIPAWANFDQQAGCFKKTNIRYFDIGALMKSYAMPYTDALQLQGAFNEELARLTKVAKLQFSTIKEEESLFYKVQEKIKSNILFFDPPSFKRINLIWLDDIYENEQKKLKLKTLLASPDMDIGVPVAVSLCQTREEIEKNFPEFNGKMITTELLSIFDSKGDKTPGFRIELEAFFKPDQKLYFYSQKKLVPNDEFKGTFKIINY
jgi:hypothetical protein